MPYIKPEQRKKFDSHIEALAAATLDAGETNYVISRYLHRLIQDYGPSYATINQAIGVLGCVMMELYRMVAAPYENKKHKQNGAVSELDS